jgi:uncharacterized protein YndB with AHSA1/START domain
MGHEFDLHDEFVVDATPEEVWAAISSGSGIDSWFMGRNEVDPGGGGAVRTAFGEYAPPPATITAWDPPRRLAYGTPEAEDGRRIGYEFLVEGRAGASTVVRLVTAGFLPGDDWADEFEAMQGGLGMFYRTLREYLDHFAGRTGMPLTVFGPPVTDWDRTWANLRARLDRSPLNGGTVYFDNGLTLGVRAPHALYRFLTGFRGPLMAAHIIFPDASPASDVDTAATEGFWQRWLEEVTA